MTKILLVEDDKSLREIYGVRLSAEGYEIVSAGDGEEALAMAIKERPTLIISDVMMPKISGFDMLDILRSTTETKDVKVIMMTALSSDDQRARGDALGADRYLVKSQVGIEDVVRTVHDVLEDGVSTPPSSTPQAFGVPITPTTISTPDPSAAAAAPVASSEPTTPAVPTSVPIAVATPDPAPAVPASSPAPISIKVQSAPSTVPPMINTPPEVPAASPFQSTPNVLPQPTAPFSSNRPGSLGDRVISPLDDEPVGPPPDMASLMSQELNGASAPANPSVPPAPEPATSQTPPAPQA